MDIQFIGENLLPGKIGQFLIVLAFASAILSTVSYYFATVNKELNNTSWTTLGRIAFRINTASVVGIAAILFYLILNHYYEYNYVYSHSSKQLPVYYIVSAYWEGQEGSFWLWSFWQAVLGNILIWRARSFENPVMAVISLSQVLLSSMLLGVEIFGARVGSSPFILLRDSVDLKAMAPVVFADAANYKNYLKFIQDGRGLNPLLQNYWMVIHPPTLFLGFASMVVPFAYAVAGLWQRRYKEWIKPAISWSLFAVMILGTGIIMGSFWAYEALNFNGFWAWDPVENASIIPWLTLIGAVHVLIAYKNTGHSYFTATLLVMVSFILVLYASFLTRSGVLGETSVHSFTDMGMFGHLIFYILVFLGIAVYLMASRWKEMPLTKKDEETYSREFWLFIGALVVAVSCIQIVFTTSVPVINKAFGTKLAPPLNAIQHYNKWQVPFAVLVTFISGFTQFMKYKRTDAKKFYFNIFASLIVAALLTVGVVLVTKVYTNLMYILLTFTCLFAILANAKILGEAFKGKFKLAGSAVAHIGFAMLLMGALIAAATSNVVSLNSTGIIPVKDFEKAEKPGENIMLIKNEPKNMDGYIVTYVSDTTVAPNTYYRVNFKKLDEKSGKITENFTLQPNVQVNPKMGLISSPDTRHFLTHDIYMHVTSAAVKEESHEDHDGHSDDENYKKPVAHEVSVGDSVSITGGYILVKELNKSPQAKDIKFQSGDLAVGLKLEVHVNGQKYDAEPIFFVRGNNKLDFAKKVDAAGLKLRFSNIMPEKQKLELMVFERPEQAKQWIVLKAVKFPYISLFWAGTIVMVVGFLLSIFRRKKELNMNEA